MPEREFTVERALWKLLWLRQRGALRQRLRGLRTFRGLSLTVIGVGFVLAWFVGAARLGPEPVVAERSWDTASIRSAARDVLPVLLLFSCLVTAATISGPAIYFSPAEVNFLFAGPFSRRALLLYKFCSYALGAAITALCVSVLTPRPVVAWAATFIGTFLTLVFIQLFSAGLGLLGQVAAARAFQRIRWLLLVSCLGVVVYAWWETRAWQTDSGLLAWLGTIRSAAAAQWLLAPFDVYARTVMASDWAGLLRWGGGAAAIDAALLGAVLILDAEYYEAVEASSQRVHERFQQYRRGRWLVSESLALDSRIPRLPRLGGVGPLVWRQLTTAWRSSRRSLLLLHALALAAGVGLDWAVQSGFSPWSLVGLGGALSIVVLPRALTYDFRGDVDQLGWLKVLPFRPLAVVLGQLLTPVLLATTIHLSVLAGALCVTPAANRWLLVTLAMVAAPVIFLHYALENLLFLLQPTRVAPIGRVDFEFFGRTLVETSVKSLVIVLGLASGVVAALFAYTGSGRQFAVALIAFAFVLLAEGLLVALLAAWTFQRSDAAEQSAGGD